jgi:hypothetical protein
MLVVLDVNGVTEVLTYNDDPVLVLPDGHSSINSIEVVNEEIIADIDVEELNSGISPTDESDFDDEDYDEDEDDGEGWDSTVARLNFYIYPVGSSELPEEDWTGVIKYLPNIALNGVTYAVAAEYDED